MPFEKNLAQAHQVINPAKQSGGSNHYVGQTDGEN